MNKLEKAMQYNNRPLRTTPIDRLVARTLKEIAAELGCTPMAVYYIEQKALKKLRREFVESS